jgi:metal-responsive CopG/Arc/MetJ family transcriptional regulator
MKAKKRKKKVRLQFDFSLNAVRRLDVLVDSTNSASRAEVIRNALRAYEDLISKREEG